MDWHHRSKKVLLTGKSGSGKSTLWLSLLKRDRARWKLVFDPDLEVSARLGWPYVSEPASLAAAVQQGLPVCFNSSALFPGRPRDGFDFFCLWVWEVRGELAGRKLFCVDEIWKFVPQRRDLPEGFALLWEEGRKQSIDVVLVAQRYNKVHDSIRAQLTELYCFQQHDSHVLDVLESDGYFRREEVQALTYPGGFLRRDLTREAHPSRV